MKYASTGVALEITAISSLVTLWDQNVSLSASASLEDVYELHNITSQTTRLFI